MIETLTDEEREELEYEAKDIEMVGSTETDFSTGIRKALRIIDQQWARIAELERTPRSVTGQHLRLSGEQAEQLHRVLARWYEARPDLKEYLATRISIEP
jgi:hypothetical protein